MRRALILACILLAACTQSASVARNTGVYLLLDTSGTYRGELRKAQDVILYTLSRLDQRTPLRWRASTPAASARRTSSRRLRSTNVRPLPMRRSVRSRRRCGDFVARENASQYTDITGGLLQAVEFLNEKGTGRKTILIFSDLEQDLEQGYKRDIEVPFKGFDVVALNVVKLRKDNYDPRQYLARLEHWKGEVEKAGGHWRVVNDLDRLDSML